MTQFKSTLILTGLFVISEANGGGLLGDIINTTIPGVGAELDKAHQKIGKPIRETNKNNFNCIGISDQAATANNDPCCLNPNLPICNELSK